MVVEEKPKKYNLNSFFKNWSYSQLLDIFSEYSDQEIHSCLLDLCWPLICPDTSRVYFTIKGTHRWGSNSRFSNARDKIIFAVNKGSAEPFSAAKKSAVQDCATCVGDSKWTVIPPVDTDPNDRQPPKVVVDEMTEKLERWIKVIKKTHRSPSRSPARSKSPQKTPLQSPTDRSRPSKINSLGMFKSEVNNDNVG